MKLCKDCKHCKATGLGPDPACIRTEEGTINLVTGEMEYTDYLHCWTERHSPQGECGEDGQYWEKKQPVLDLSKGVTDGLRMKPREEE